MPETAPAQVARLVHLIAWMSQRDTGKPTAYRAAAKHMGVSEKTIRADLDVLVRLTDEYKSWLSSLSVAFTADGFMLESHGPFRRPFRLTADETLALVLGLAGTPKGQAIATKMGGARAKTPTSISLGPTPSAQVEQVLALVRQARDEQRQLEMVYCGSDSEPGRRVVNAYQVVQRQLWWYVVAWCETTKGYRHFRVDRVLEAKLLDGRFTPRADVEPIEKPEEVFRADETTPATVAFSPRIARWLKEKYPNGRLQSDGRYVVTFRVADPAWFVREVLQYGAEAEVVGPAALREAVKRAISASVS